MKRMSLMCMGLLVLPAIVVTPPGLSAQSAPEARRMTLAVGGGKVSSMYVGDSFAVPGRDQDVWFTYDRPGLELTGQATRARKGITFGASLHIPIGGLGGRLSLITGGQYVQKGVWIEGNGVKAEMNVDYLDVPMLLSVRLTGTDSPIGVSVFAGASASFEAGCKVVKTLEGATTKVDCDAERLSTDLSRIFGAEVRVPITERLDILVSGGSDYGFRALDVRDQDNVKNHHNFASIRIGFPIGG